MPSRALKLAAAITFLPLGCSFFHSSRPERLADGNERVQCDKPLSACLVAMDDACPNGYEIVRAAETHERRGASPVIVETFRSEAVVHCTDRPGLFGPGAAAKAPEGSRAPATPLPPLPAPVVPSVAPDGAAVIPVDGGSPNDGALAPNGGESTIRT